MSENGEQQESSPSPDGSAGIESPKRFIASIHNRDVALPPAFVEIVHQIETALDCKVLMLLQDGRGSLGQFSHELYRAMSRLVRDEIEPGSRVAVLLHSSGGSAEAAYQLARLLTNHCGGYIVIVPLYAKSAATLFSLGADRLIMGDYAELGPLDAQVDDPDRERQISALEVTQSLERLNSEALQAVDYQMFHWCLRTGKRMDVLLPIATKFVAEMMRPLFDKIDTVQYVQMARILKVAQDYAERLLKLKYDATDAEEIAARLTKNYSDHGFVIDSAELADIGIAVDDDSGEIKSII